MFFGIFSVEELENIVAIRLSVYSESPIPYTKNGYMEGYEEEVIRRECYLF